MGQPAGRSWSHGRAKQPGTSPPYVALQAVTFISLLGAHTELCLLKRHNVPYGYGNDTFVKLPL